MNTKQYIICPHCNTINNVASERLTDNPKCGKCKQALFTQQPVNLTSQNFAQHIKSHIPVVIDFWAPWCAPCRSMAPVFAQVTEQLEPHYRFAKVDTEAQQAIGTQYNIRSIPTLVIFQKEQEINRQAGAMSAENIIQWIKNSKIQ